MNMQQWAPFGMLPELMLGDGANTSAKYQEQMGAVKSVVGVSILGATLSVASMSMPHMAPPVDPALAPINQPAQLRAINMARASKPSVLQNMNWPVHPTINIQP